MSWSVPAGVRPWPGGEQQRREWEEQPPSSREGRRVVCRLRWRCNDDGSTCTASEGTQGRCAHCQRCIWGSGERHRAGPIALPHLGDVPVLAGWLMGCRAVLLIIWACCRRTPLGCPPALLDGLSDESRLTMRLSKCEMGRASDRHPHFKPQLACSCSSQLCAPSFLLLSCCCRIMVHAGPRCSILRCLIAQRLAGRPVICCRLELGLQFIQQAVLCQLQHVARCRDSQRQVLDAHMGPAAACQVV